MYQRILAVLALAWAFALNPAMAADEELCLDCHEPAEDWQGMSAEEILEHAKSPEVKRHADNRELSDDELKAIIEKLLAPQ